MFRFIYDIDVYYFKPLAIDATLGAFALLQQNLLKPLYKMVGLGGMDLVLSLIIALILVMRFLLLVVKYKKSTHEYNEMKNKE